jgi:hypothetical protein
LRGEKRRGGEEREEERRRGERGEKLQKSIDIARTSTNCGAEDNLKNNHLFVFQKQNTN